VKELTMNCEDLKDEDSAQLKTGEWVHARPIPNLSIPARLREAWDVLRGKADALYWKGQP
jgi:hypothetical protein